VTFPEVSSVDWERGCIRWRAWAETLAAQLGVDKPEQLSGEDLQNAIERATGALECERDTGYEFLRRWQTWATLVMRLLGEVDEHTLPDDTRTRETVLKALGELVELRTLVREVRAHLLVPEPWPGGPCTRDMVIGHLCELIQKEVQGRVDAHELAEAELKAERTAREAVMEFATLILHGTDEHKRWLLQAAKRFASGERTNMGALLGKEPK
jgi:hypothetical protein